MLGTNVPPKRRVVRVLFGTSFTSKYVKLVFTLDVLYQMMSNDTR